MTSNAQVGQEPENTTPAAVIDFEASAAVAGPLMVDLDGYEGPLDVLLTLAREQKVDLRRISILQLAEQYLAFIAAARKLRLEVAAEYLVMAAWLAYLKSRLLLPEPPGQDEPSGAELAGILAFRLRKLEAMREAANQLMARHRFGQDMFARGMPEGVQVIRKSVYECKIYDFLKCYGEFRTSRGSVEVLPLRMARANIFALDEALQRLRKLVGATPEWAALQSFLPPGIAEPLSRRSALASTFGASLELARQGTVELRQMQAFGPIYMRRHPKAGMTAEQES
jgi:segregation and condensation protein A